MQKKDKYNNSVGPQVRGKKNQYNKAIPILAFLFLIAGLWASTQFFAYQFNYHSSLGDNYQGIYMPWAILYWMNDWYASYSDQFMKAGSIGVIVTGTGLIVLIVIKMIGANSAKANKYLHGSARWANIKDIKESGLMSRDRTLLEIITGKPPKKNSGVYVGGWLDKKGEFHYLRHDGPEHVLMYAPTRSGKGVGLVLPTLLSWGHSAVITDLKGELWALTSGWRQKHAQNKVLRFEPAAIDGSVCWNPLDEIRIESEYEIGDAQNLATLIVDPDGKGLNDHWQKTSQALLVGLIIHVLYKAKHEGIIASLPFIDKLLADPERDVSELWMEMVTYAHINGETHPIVGAAARDMMDRPEEEAGSVLSTTKSYLSLYRDPIIAKNTSYSEFKIKDLMNCDEAVSLYIVTQPNDKARLRPLVRILVNMIIRLNADKMNFENGRPVAHYKHRLLLMLDEFPSLGKLEIMQESLAFLAGYGIKAYLICQDINQLRSRETGYGHDEQITSNCHVQNAFPPNRIETAEHLSKLTGTTTVISERITTSGRRTSALLGNVSRTMQETSRPLLTADECLRMPGATKDGEDKIIEAGDMIVYVAGYPAIYGKQPLYFKDPVFQARAEVPAPRKSDRIHYVNDPDNQEITL